MFKWFCHLARIVVRVLFRKSTGELQQLKESIIKRKNDLKRMKGEIENLKLRTKKLERKS